MWHYTDVAIYVLCDFMDERTVKKLFEISGVGFNK